MNYTSIRMSDSNVCNSNIIFNTIVCDYLFWFNNDWLFILNEGLLKNLKYQLELFVLFCPHACGTLSQACLADFKNERSAPLSSSRGAKDVPPLSEWRDASLSRKSCSTGWDCSLLSSSGVGVGVSDIVNHIGCTRVCALTKTQGLCYNYFVVEMRRYTSTICNGHQSMELRPYYDRYQNSCKRIWNKKQAMENWRRNKIFIYLCWENSTYSDEE